MASIKYLKDESGNKISPVVSVDSIFTSGGGKLIDYIYPVGSIYMSVSSTNPGNLFGGTWVAWGQGKVPVGVNTGDTDFSTVEKTGGEKAHCITLDETPAHTHSFRMGDSRYGQGDKYCGVVARMADSNLMPLVAYDEGKYNLHTNANTYVGGNEAHNNLQPYITCYMWKRTK